MANSGSWKSPGFEFGIESGLRPDSLRTHFTEASTAVGDPLEIAIQVYGHSMGEHRFLGVGRSGPGRVPVVSCVERTTNRIRVIGARRVSLRELRDHEPVWQ